MEAAATTATTTTTTTTGEYLIQLLSTSIGYAVILGSSFVKVPQILNIVKSRSAAGLSMASIALELLGYVISVAYAFAQAFPFSTYGESVFLTVQDIIIVFFVFVFGGKSVLLSTLFCGGFSAAVFVITFYKVVPLSVLTFAQGCTILIFMSSKLPQIYLNFKSKNTGQLSLITYGCNFAGSLARIFTTITDLSDPIILTSYVMSSFLNFLIAAQIVYYGKNKKGTETKDKKDTEEKKKKKSNNGKKHK